MTRPGDAAATTPGFAAALRARTRAAHTAAEQSGFLDQLLAGRLAPAAHAALLAQTHLVYDVLEQAWAAHRADPVVAPFLRPELLRLPALEADLRFLLGAGWRPALEPTPATRQYVRRLRAVAFDWPAGFVAHHYVRYLGDLSGGQVLRRLLGRAYGWQQEGLRFYTFEGVRAPKPFKDAYRALLDAAPWDAAEQDRVVAEVEGAYRLNADLFADLERQAARWAR
jgi:heme oxygenase (biliverdin-producing, ferredoxin)